MMKRSNNRWCAMQPELGFGARSWRSAVESLMRFRAWHELNDESLLGTGGVFNCAVTYEAWLRFYTPLCERGQS